MGGLLRLALFCVGIWVLGLGGRGAWAEGADCEKIYRDRLAALQKRNNARRADLDAEFDAREAALKQQQARLEQMYKDARVQAVKPEPGLVARQQAAWDRLRSLRNQRTDKSIALREATRVPDREWDARVAEIKKIESAIEQAERDLKKADQQVAQDRARRISSAQDAPGVKQANRSLEERALSELRGQRYDASEALKRDYQREKEWLGGLSGPGDALPLCHQESAAGPAPGDPAAACPGESAAQGAGSIR